MMYGRSILHFADLVGCLHFGHIRGNADVAGYGRNGRSCPKAAVIRADIPKRSEPLTDPRQSVMLLPMPLFIDSKCNSIN